ncbi:MAG: class I SAM-dependent methyltransferase [Brevundimonas sp.]|uniref:class I SAM-dependent methyltransferase n=1 Tax=Brevundimonas sp. TaxID=1871086 RepID=UPI002735A9EA|nr:class I SAM-dependent methyltransferase [Brevundimonas sp.]MDP3405470.1 class I SAM-dependent methyltransferase [Brevundimonas sp.]
MAILTESASIAATRAYRDGETGILDPDLRAKLYALPQIMADWLAPFGGFEGQRVLDFGCGFGETAAGIALGHGAAEVRGVDIQPKPEGCAGILREHLGLEALPVNLNVYQIEPGAPVGRGDLDIVVSWSTVEHVARGLLDGVLGSLHVALRPGGLAFIQISPLYFSPEGSHLWALGYRGWEHLSRQTSEVLEAIEGAPWLDAKRKARMTRMFLTLNRLTAEELVDRVGKAGFSVLREQRDRTDLVPPHALTQAYALEALMTQQVVLLLRRD